MTFSLSLLLNALVTGTLLGGFYCVAAMGVTISFGMLDIVNIAHPAFMLAGAYITYWANARLGMDPILASILALPLGFVLGRLLYRFYEIAFERRGEQSLQGLAFFFGIMFIVEVALLLGFGVDYRIVNAPYIGPTFTLGDVIIPLRLLIPAVLGLTMAGGVILYTGRSFIGRAILAVSQDPGALRLVGGNPTRVKEIAMGISIASALFAGGLFVIIQPISPEMGRDFIGRVFAICVLGGMTSLTGTIVASMLLGIAEAMTSSFFGPSWAPAVSFGLLLITLAARPAGIFGR